MENVGCTRWGLRRHIRVVIYIYTCHYLLEIWKTGVDLSGHWIGYM